MEIIDYPSRSADVKVKSIMERGLVYEKKDFDYISQIIDHVRQNGDQALIEYTNRFDSDRIQKENLRVSQDEIEAARSQVSEDFQSALERAITQIETFHRHQLEKSWIDTPRPGTFLGQLVRPVQRAGLYVPGGMGGETPLVSSVLMCGIPAKTAGVDHAIMATPPRKDGTINPYLLFAAESIGIDAIYKVGSAWGIAAMAFGTETVPSVDVIVGPGNIYVTLAKKILAGQVGIDMIAGPSEILVIADEGADPEFAAADLLSQAEHDPLSSAILITDSRTMAENVSAAIGEQLKSLTRSEIARQSLTAYGVILVVKNIDTAVDIANRIAPEHLELLIRDPFAVIGGIRNAGAVFMGDYTPEPVGDYIAGPNHVLPTAGTARFSSALSVDHFVKKTSLIHYTKAAFENEAEDIMKLARIEGLSAHANSVRLRLK